MVIDNISQWRNLVNSSAQGSEQKVTTRHGAHFPLNAHGRCEFEMRKKVENDELHSFEQFQTSASSIINFRYPELVCKMTTIGEGLLAIICKMLPKIQMYYKKVQIPHVQQSMFMLLYALFILFIVRHTDNFRFDRCNCIGNLMAHAMIRELLYSEFDR